MSNKLTPAQQTELTNRLIEEQSTLRGQLLRQMNELDRDEMNALTDRLQQQPDDGDWGTLLKGAGWPDQDANLKRLLLVEASLVLTEQEMYGICSDCETEIDTELLFDDPARQRCPACQNRYDKRDRNRQYVIL